MSEDQEQQQKQQEGQPLETPVLPVPTPLNGLQQSKGIRSYGASDINAWNEAVSARTILYGLEATKEAGVVAPKWGVTAVYGDVLFDEEGYVVRPHYDANDSDAVEEQMNRLPTAALTSIASQMKNAGFYGEGDPSSMIMNGRGYDNGDILAFSYLLRYSNSQNKILTALNLGSLPKISTGGKAVKVTSDDDIRYYLDQAFLARMGRKPKREDIDSMVKAIQDSERKASAMNQTTPSASVAAKLQAEKASPEEGAAYQTGNAIRLAFKYLGGEA